MTDESNRWSTMTEEPSLEQRKNELFAIITLLAGAKRDIAAAQAAGHDASALYDHQAQLEAAKERLSHEVNSEYMYRNLQAFMNRVDDYDTARKAEHAAYMVELRDGSARLGKLEAGQERIAHEYTVIIDRLDHKRQEIEQIKRELAELQAWRHAQERDGDANGG